MPDTFHEGSELSEDSRLITEGPNGLDAVIHTNLDMQICIPIVVGKKMDEKVSYSLWFNNLESLMIFLDWRIQLKGKILPWCIFLK